jgi:hypothetical protein
VEEEDVVLGPAVPLPPIAPIERRAFDYSDLERGMTWCSAGQGSRSTRLSPGAQPGVKSADNLGATVDL